MKSNFVYFMFCAIHHYAKLPLYRYVTTMHFITIMKTCHYANKPLCRLAIMQICLHADLALCRLAFMQTCHNAVLPLCRFATTQACHYANLP